MMNADLDAALALAMMVALVCIALR